MDPEYDIDHESNIEELLQIARYYAAPTRVEALERAGWPLIDLGYLAQLVVALDGWITHDGALPSRWMRNARPQAAAARRRHRQVEPASPPELAKRALEQIRELLWPPGDLDAEWDYKTLDAIARVMYAAGFGPEERDARAPGKRPRRAATGDIQARQIVELALDRDERARYERELSRDPLLIYFWPPTYR